MTAGSGSPSIQNLINDIDTRLQRVIQASVAVAGFSDAIERSRAFNRMINDIRSSAISKMVDADVETEQATIQALMVRQQLVMTALSIINRSRANVLLLFRS